MFYHAWFLSIYSIVCLSRAQYIPPEALVEPLKPTGIRISIPDEEGITLVAYHVKFNEEFYGLEAGTIARDILKQKNGRWTYQDKTTKLKENDVIYYWVHVVYNGLGYNLIDQEHRVTSFYDINGQRVGDENTSSNNNNFLNNNQSCIQSVTKVYNSLGVSRYVCSGELLFEDNFKDLDQLKKKQWTVVEKFSGAPDYEFVVYKDSRDNLNVNKGLKITPKLLRETSGDDFIRGGNLTLKHCTGQLNTYECSQQARGWGILPPITSGRINTRNFLNFEYGRIEIRAQFPSGDWIYPLIVLEPSVFFGEVPTTQIRVASASGNPELRTFDGTDISGHILWGGMVRSDSNGFRNRMTKYNRELWSKNYHTYEFSWSPNKVVRKVDGEIYDERKLNFATLTPCFFTLGVAVGGLLEFPDFCISKDYAKTWRNVEAKAMYNFYLSTNTWHKTWVNGATSLKVDYVKIWAL